MIEDNARFLALDKLLKNEDADYSIYQDNVNLGSAEAGAKHYGISMAETTPTIILQAKDHYFAAIICGDRRIAFKKLKQALDIKDIKMADPQTVLTITGSQIGEVSLINPALDTVIDSSVLNNKSCYGGSGMPKTTLRISTQDLVKITHAKILDFTDPRT